MEVEYNNIKNSTRIIGEKKDVLANQIKKVDFVPITPVPETNETVAISDNIIDGTAIVEQVISFDIACATAGKLILGQGHEIPDIQIVPTLEIDFVKPEISKFAISKKYLTSIPNSALIQDSVNGALLTSQGTFAGTASITGAFTSFSQYYAFLLQEKRKIKSIKIYMSSSSDTVMSKGITLASGFKTVFGQNMEKPIRLDNTFSKDQFQESILECQFKDGSYIPIGKANYLSLECGRACQFTIFITVI